MTDNFTELAFTDSVKALQEEYGTRAALSKDGEQKQISQQAHLGEKMTQQLLTPFTLGPHQLRNRVIMAPLTRMRSLPGNVPGPLNATYYEQRASMGLIITEASQVSPEGIGYPGTPGIYSPEQVEGWKLITQAVHERGGKIFLQLWHVGRVSHPSLQKDHAFPLAPSAIPMQSPVFTSKGEMADPVTPRALEIEEIPKIIDQFRTGARNALEAGFDGVEVHSAYGYLLDQFLQDGTNQRTDNYGGSFENRTRLLLQVVEAVTEVVGADSVGVRLSPHGTFNDMSDSNGEELFAYVVKSLNPFGLAYLHLVEPRTAGGIDVSDYQGEAITGILREIFNGTMISAGGYDRESGNQAIEKGIADLIAYGRQAIANPDLPERFAKKAQLNPYDRATFYGGDERGYTDYPTLHSN
jgi:N-ethylmaleimide reductase